MYNQFTLATNESMPNYAVNKNELSLVMRVVVVSLLLLSGWIANDIFNQNTSQTSIFMGEGMQETDILPTPAAISSAAGL